MYLLATKPWDSLAYWIVFVSQSLGHLEQTVWSQNSGHFWSNSLHLLTLARACAMVQRWPMIAGAMVSWIPAGAMEPPAIGASATGVDNAGSKDHCSAALASHIVRCCILSCFSSRYTVMCSMRWHIVNTKCVVHCVPGVVQGAAGAGLVWYWVVGWGVWGGAGGSLAGLMQIWDNQHFL